MLTSITLLHFGRGEPRLTSALLLELGTLLTSSLAFNLRSPAGHTIFEYGGRHRSVEEKAETKTKDASVSGDFNEKGGVTYARAGTYGRGSRETYKR